jgi:hypothetical protein
MEFTPVGAGITGFRGAEEAPCTTYKGIRTLLQASFHDPHFSFYFLKHPPGHAFFICKHYCTSGARGATYVLLKAHSQNTHCVHAFEIISKTNLKKDEVLPPDGWKTASFLHIPRDQQRTHKKKMPPSIMAST